ncbi:hypothetical protein G4V39_10790 [Thermosulfuriphilus ammonigenes]|uniref:Uncharacterized protein n=1 Tax=Thermosulfuriphilus ammonigenes TaxID=1936021 RepID=A0A6G7PZA3_9BACT|nr:hypothetical protein [Thermosulfuriphilus ammonigenes]MBA2849046.1 hypothetical protein [Thermosulfuriphilus ammonigenes]QIJ72733.1 hypothetical protein G4V39_10790 [Thermosulfuriphilus ammonigenes]
MALKYQELIKDLSLEEIKDLFLALASQVFSLLDEESQKEIVLRMFGHEEGQIPSMVYY